MFPVPPVQPVHPSHYKFIGSRKKIIWEFPLNLIWAHFTGKSLVFFYKGIPCKIVRSFYREILCIFYKRIPCKILQGNPLYFFRLLVRFQKNPTLRVFLNFFIRTPNMTKIKTHKKFVRTTFIYIYIFKYILV